MEVVGLHHPTVRAELKKKKSSENVRADVREKCPPEVSHVGDDALRKLADVDKEQQEGEDPP